MPVSLKQKTLIPTSYKQNNTLSASITFEEMPKVINEIILKMIIHCYFCILFFYLSNNYKKNRKKTIVYFVGIRLRD